MSAAPTAQTLRTTNVGCAEGSDRLSTLRTTNVGCAEGSDRLSTLRTTNVGCAEGSDRLSPFPPPLAARHIDLERTVQQGVERIVPLAEVLHGLSAGAQFELDQPEQVVLRVQGVADAAQVVDLAASDVGVTEHA